MVMTDGRASKDIRDVGTHERATHPVLQLTSGVSTPVLTQPDRQPLVVAGSALNRS